VGGAGVVCRPGWEVFEGGAVGAAAGVVRRPCPVELGGPEVGLVAAAAVRPVVPAVLGAIGVVGVAVAAVDTTGSALLSPEELVVALALVVVWPLEDDVMSLSAAVPDAPCELGAVVVAAALDAALDDALLPARFDASVDPPARPADGVRTRATFEIQPVVGGGAAGVREAPDRSVCGDAEVWALRWTGPCDDGTLGAAVGVGLGAPAGGPPESGDRVTGGDASGGSPAPPTTVTTIASTEVTASTTMARMAAVNATGRAPERAKKTGRGPGRLV
jgi:hypothetical protein